MESNLVREFHDSVASESDLAHASLRPHGTSAHALDRMVEDVVQKLGIGATTSVVEVGCGVGVLALGIAPRVSRYLGLDFAPQAIRRLADRFAANGLAARASAEVVDMVTATTEEIAALGTYDRVIVYSVLHYARSEAEARAIVRRSIQLANPGGVVLFGNLPLAHLSQPTGQHPLQRVARRLGWLFRSEAWIPAGLAWKLQVTVWDILRRLRRPPGARFDLTDLPPGYCVALTRANTERWVREAGRDVALKWLPARPGVPLHNRPDLLVEVQGGN
jgi:2-polyprenyl-3-methyl-5-hydroxy-6-metoxy-1,4-benzoquinol methylase